MKRAKYTRREVLEHTARGAALAAAASDMVCRPLGAGVDLVGTAESTARLLLQPASTSKNHHRLALERCCQGHTTMSPRA